MESTTDYLGLLLDGEGPLHRQLYQTIRSAILSGKLTEGTRLPATRRLAESLGISRNTVLHAFEQLSAEGFLVGKTGVGTHVASPLPSAFLKRQIPSEEPPKHAPKTPKWSAIGRRLESLQPMDPGIPKPRYDFRYGHIVADERLRRMWQRLITRTAGNYPVDYGAPVGTPALRSSLANYLHTRGCRCHPDQILIVNGSQQALDLIARLLLDEQDHVAIEDPGYLGARNAFITTGANLHGIPLDDEGLIVERVPAFCKLVYVTPSHQFPTGAVLSLRRRLALLEWAQQNDSWIVEDDYDGEYRFEGRPIEAVQGLDRYGRTLYVGTFSKILFPASRLGYIVLPETMVDVFTAAKWGADRHTPVLKQLALAEFIDSGEFERHLRRMRKRYDHQRAALIDALNEALDDYVEITGTRAGLHLMVALKGLKLRELERLIAAAREQDVGLYSSDRLYLDERSESSLLMGYATLNPLEIREGIKRIANLSTQLIGNADSTWEH